MRVGLGLADQAGEDGVEFGAHGDQPAPRAPSAQVAVQRRYQDELRAQFDHLGHQRPQSIELGSLGAEDTAKDGVEGDPHHRLAYRKLLPVRPIRHFLERLGFDQAFVGAHPVAVKRRQQQAAVPQMFGTLKSERRAGPEHQAEVGLRGAHGVGRLLEQFLRQSRVGDHDAGPEEGQPHGERGAEPVVQGVHQLLAAGEVGDVLGDLRPARGGWQAGVRWNCLCHVQRRPLRRMLFRDVSSKSFERNDDPVCARVGEARQPCAVIHFSTSSPW